MISDLAIYLRNLNFKLLVPSVTYRELTFKRDMNTSGSDPDCMTSGTGRSLYQ
jgi:hypothetical protein